MYCTGQLRQNMLQEQRSDLCVADNTSIMLTFMPAADTNTAIVIARPYLSAL